MRGFCARCGKPLVEGRSVGALCLDCFLETQRVLCVPKRIEFEYCKYCGSIRVGHRWLPGGELGDAVRSYLEHMAGSVKPCISEVERYRLASVEPLSEPSWRTLYRLVFAVRLRGVDEEARQGYLVEVYARPTVCPACKMARGGDYNVLVQIRGASPRRIAGALSRLFEKDAHVVESIVDVVERRNGADLLLSDRGAASRIIKELEKSFRVKLRATGEDVGVTSQGRMRRRLVYSVRIEKDGR